MATASFDIRFRRFVVLHYVFERDVGGEAEGAVAQVHGVTERHNAADDGPSHPFVLVGRARERFAHGDYFAGGLAAGDGPGMRRTHHDALEDSLAADEGFFAAFKGGEKLHGYQEAHEISQRTHCCWMLRARKRTKY